MTDRDFWMLIRRALLMVCDAIERKYSVETLGDKRGRKKTAQEGK